MATHEDRLLDAAKSPHPHQLEVHEFETYDLVIDARSPREFADDHIPSAQNLPVVDDLEYAEVGTTHRVDPHAAYLRGVEYSLVNMANHVKAFSGLYAKDARMLVYCFRGGKRSKLWADTLRTIGYNVDVLRGGWKAYRRWVMASLATLPMEFEFRVLAGATGCGKTRLLHALEEVGQQVLDLEAIASHRGSLIGAIPGVQQPSQKLFDTEVLHQLRRMSRGRPVWVEAESKKIGNLQLPIALHNSMHQATPYLVSAPMAERVRLWHEDYPHFAKDPTAMVQLLMPLRPLVGGQVLDTWAELASQRRTAELFEQIMVTHYDPCYQRSTKRSYKRVEQSIPLELESLSPAMLHQTALKLVESGS